MKIEIAKENLVVFERKDGLITSVLRDLMTLAVLSLCVYVSRNSDFWTFITGIFFIVYIFSRMMSIFNRQSMRFKTWAEFKAWVDAETEQEVKSGCYQVVQGDGNVQAGGDVIYRKG